MRNIIILVALTAILLAGSIFSDLYIKSATDEMLTEIDKVETPEEVKNLTKRWNELSSIAELVIDHNEIDLLNQHLWAMEIESTGDREEFEESRKLAKEMFLHIRSRNILKPNNVF